MRTRLNVALWLALIITATSAAASALEARYVVGVDGQDVRCLPWSVFLIDRDGAAPSRRALYAFRAERMHPVVRDGTTVVKRIVALPGDHVRVRDATLSVNDEPIATLDATVLARLGRSAASFERDAALGPAEYLFLGNLPSSYDGRYWGTVRRDQLIGAARGLW